MAKRVKDDAELDLDAMDAGEDAAEPEDLLSKYGIDFVEKEHGERDAKTGELRRTKRGWIARRTTPAGRVEYAGPTLAWTFMGLAGSFLSLDVAKVALRHWCESQERQAVEWPKNKIADVTIEVPMAVNPVNELPATYAQVNLTPELRMILNSLYQGLRQRNETVKDKPVSNASDCLRWLLYRLQRM